MTWQAWVIGALAVVALLLAGYVVSLRRRLSRADEPAPGTVEPVATERRTPEAPGALEAPQVAGDQEYVITTVGTPEQPTRGRAVPDAVVLSATLGEPLVKVVAFAHGLRRALSATNRNRIGFEVRQEVRRSRKVRRQEMRVAWRRMKAEERAGGAVREREDGLGETA